LREVRVPVRIYVEENDCRIDVAGLLIYKRKAAGEESARELLNDFHSQTLDFNLCLGAFRIVIEDKRNDEKVLFCDNGGNLCFYIDLEKNRVSDSFLELVRQRHVIVPNYQSIAQFLQFGYIYGDDMMCMGIIRTNPCSYYRINGYGSVETLEKKLRPFEELKEYTNLHDLMGQLVKSSKILKVAATITGGTDSRTILSHLISHKQRPQLVISGKHTDMDVQIASKIAEKLKLTLLFVDEHPDDEKWISTAFEASDGVCGTFRRYRLYKKSKQLETAGFDMTFEGVAGELYKNSFINQDIPFYGGKADLRKFYKLKVARYAFPDNLCGEAIKEPLNHMEKTILGKIICYNGPSKYKTYNSIGYYLLQQRLLTLSNSAEKYCLRYSPLMERDCVALSYVVNPYKLEMQAFQRNEISKYCSEIVDIPTDRGLSCSNRRSAVIFDSLKHYKYLLNIAFRRIYRRKEVLERKMDMIYTLGLDSKEYEETVSYCKYLKIIPDTVRKEDIPPAISDRIVTVGLLLKR